MVHLFVHGFMRPTLRAQTGIASRYTLAKTAWRSYALVSSARFDKPNCVSLIEESVYRQLRPIVKSHTTLLLCISGGSDSMAMLHIMHQIKSKMIPDLNLQVIHFNHKVRVESEVEVINFLCGEPLVVAPNYFILGIK